MKNIYLIVLFLLLFSGCATTQMSIQNKSIDKKSTPTNNSTSIAKSNSVEKNEIQLNEDDTSTSVDDSYKIAIIFPSKVVGKYAKDSINTIMAYLLHNNIKFHFEVFDSFTQDNNSLVDVFNEINEKEFTNVIALFTKDVSEDLFTISGIDKLNLYLPLVNKHEVLNAPINIVFGGIDYKAQINTLLNLSNKKNSIFYSDSSLGFKLKEYVEASEQLVKVTTKIDKNSNVFKKIVKNRALRNSSLFLNTSIIKSSIILSQLRAYGTVPYKILSTQLNYTPLVISLTQYPDRKNFVIANSISKTDFKLQESLLLLDADIEYNWVNYSTLVGVDSLFSKTQSQLFPEKIIDNQVSYDVLLYKNTRHGFKKLRTN